MEIGNPSENINLMITKMADPVVFHKICSTYAHKKRKSFKQEFKSCEINKRDKKSLIFNEAKECLKILPFSVKIRDTNNLQSDECKKVVRKRCVRVPTPAPVLHKSLKDPNSFNTSEANITHSLDACILNKISKIKNVSRQSNNDINHAKKQNSNLDNIVVLSSDDSSEDEAIKHIKCARNAGYCESSLNVTRNEFFSSSRKNTIKDSSRLNYTNLKTNGEMTEQKKSLPTVKNSLTDSESFSSKNTASRIKSTSKLNQTLSPELEVLSANEGSELNNSNLKNTKSLDEVDLVILSSDNSENDEKKILQPKRKNIKRLNRKFKHGVFKHNTLKNQSKFRNFSQNRTLNSSKASGVDSLPSGIVPVSDELRNCKVADVTPLFTLSDSSDCSVYEEHNSITCTSNKSRSRLNSANYCKRKKSCIANKFTTDPKSVKSHNPTKFSAVKCKAASRITQNIENNIEVKESLNTNIRNSTSGNRESSGESTVELFNGNFVEKKLCMNQIQKDAKKSILLDSKKIFAPGRFIFKSTMLDTSSSPVQLKDLDFVPEPVTFKIPKLHESERVYWLSKEDQQKFRAEGIDIKLGRFSPEEDKILKRNFLKFCRDFGINDPDFLLGINNDLRKDSILCQFLRAKHFYLRLAKDLDNRTLHSIYLRARKLFYSVHRKKWGFKDVSKLIQLQRQLGNEWHEIGKMLKRDSIQCENVFTYLKKNYKLDKVLKKCIK